MPAPVSHWPRLSCSHSQMFSSLRHTPMGKGSGVMSPSGEGNSPDSKGKVVINSIGIRLFKDKGPALPAGPPGATLTAAHAVAVRLLEELFHQYPGVGLQGR